MKRTTDEIEGPVKRNPLILISGVFILLILIVLGVIIMIEAFKTPEGPSDVLDTKRMIASGVGVIIFSVAVFFFLLKLFKDSSKRSTKKKPVKRRTRKRKK